MQVRFSTRSKHGSMHPQLYHPCKFGQHRAYSYLEMKLAPKTLTCSLNWKMQVRFSIRSKPGSMHPQMYHPCKFGHHRTYSYLEMRPTHKTLTSLLIRNMQVRFSIRSKSGSMHPQIVWSTQGLLPSSLEDGIVQLKFFTVFGLCTSSLL